MRAALIPPKGWYKTARQSDFHLILAQIDQMDYQDVYLSEGIENDFLIVDNGAAEGNMVSDKKLFSRANFYAANEIVLPDVMMDARQTLDRAVAFFRENDEVIRDEHNFMGVVQARESIEDAIDCIKAYEKMPQVKTLGIPRHLVDRGDYARYQICKWLGDQSSLKGRFNVHLLGTNTRFPLEIRMIAQAFDWVRSCDTSMPYNYAIAEEKLTPDKHNVRRPLDYFTEHQRINKGLLEYNINTYLGWARGESTGS